MCGICGIFSVDGRPVNEDLVQRMTTAMIHRGPDGYGTYFDGIAGLGHRRLSIIDIEGGAQPLANEDEKLQVVFNGEIYNFIELREELRAAGHSFRTKSDTEVIVHAYEQWGKECVRHFNGMFAFALWDGRRRELFLARDHLGIKPLYYTEQGNKVSFASEIKALLQDRSLPREVDTEALSELFTFRYVPSPKTLFKGIWKLPPGHRMIISSRGLEIDRFWDWTPNIRERYEEKALIEEYRFLLEDAVRLQLRSDVPLGLFLSSGIDSGCLLAIMSKYCGEPVRAYTIGFEGGEKTNEIDDAHRMAQMFGAEHCSMVVTADDYLKYYERYLWDLEEPLGNESAAAFYFVSKIASREVKVALAGQGADEPWAGYDRHLGVKLSEFYSRLPYAITRGVAPLLARGLGRFERLKRGIQSLAEPDILTRFAKVYSFFSQDMKRALFKEPLKEQLTAGEYRAKEALRRLQEGVQHLDPLSQMLYVDTRAGLPDDLLMVGDKTSMANSIEARVPYLDYRLVEFIESLPPQLKLKGFTAKYLHKKALTKWLTRDVIYRKKKGFVNPVENWFRTSLRPFVEECLLSESSVISHYFDQQYIRGMLDADRSGREQLRRHIYLLVSFEQWHRTFIGN
jgi:asparagine synthase (glutamine-hydrolysing)